MRRNDEPGNPRTFVTASHGRATALALALVASCSVGRNASAQQVVEIYPNLPKTIVTTLAASGDKPASLECPPTSPVATLVASDPATVVNGKYEFPNVIVRLVNLIPARGLSIACSVTRDGEAPFALKLSLPPVALGNAKASLTPLSVTRGGAIVPAVSVWMPVADRNLPVESATVVLKLLSTSMTAVTNVQGTATFGPWTLQDPRDTIKQVAAKISIDNNTEVEAPLAVSPRELVDITVPQSSVVASAGLPFTINLQGVDAAKQPVCNVRAISVSRNGGTGVLHQVGSPPQDVRAKCTSDGKGMVIDNLIYDGTLEDFDLNIAANGNPPKTVHVTTRPGKPAALRFVQEPPLYLVPNADANMTPVPKLRLEDAFGNPVSNSTIALRLMCPGESCKRGYISGTSFAVTDKDGNADFTGVRFVGTEGPYVLCFEDISSGKPSEHCTLGGSPFAKWEGNYSVDREFNKSFVIISAIHSIAGHRPASEFFDLRFRFRMPGGFSTLVAADLNIERASTADKDTASVKNSREVTDAVAMVNWSLRQRIAGVLHDVMRVTDARSDALDRQLILGGQLRIFSGVPYAGVHAGSVEMGHSPFFGSSVTAGILRPLSYLPVKLGDEPAIYPTHNNIIVEGFIRSTAVEFFKYLNVRATFLIPMETARRIQNRIAVAVPIGTITDF